MTRARVVLLSIGVSAAVVLAACGGGAPAHRSAARPTSHRSTTTTKAAPTTTTTAAQQAAAACIDSATATHLFLTSGASGIQGTEQIQQITCTGSWAEGTIIDGPNAAGNVAYRFQNGAWQYAASAAFYSSFCSQLAQLGAPPSMMGQCPAGSTTTTTTAPNSAPCEDSLLAAAASAWESQNGNPDGTGSSMQFYACVGGFAGVVYTPGNDPGTGATMAFESVNGAWTVLGAANMLPQSPQIPASVYQQLSSELSSYSSNNTTQTF